MTQVIIELIDGYFVEADELNHTLKKRYIGKSKEGQEKQMEKVIGYYKSVQDCVERIVRLIPIDENDGAVISLREYAEAAGRDESNLVYADNTVVLKKVVIYGKRYIDVTPIFAPR